MMRITKGDKTINIPGWALFVDALVVDNIVANVCKASTVTKLLIATKAGKMSKEEYEMLYKEEYPEA